MKTFPVPICTIWFNPETGYYGFSCRFEGQRPHYAMDTFRSLEDVLSWLDPHRDYIWEDASDADENSIMIARAHKQGSVAWACETLPARCA